MLRRSELIRLTTKSDHSIRCAVMDTGHTMTQPWRAAAIWPNGEGQMMPPSSGKSYGLARVCRVGRAVRATIYCRRLPPRTQSPWRRGPMPPVPYRRSWAREPTSWAGYTAQSTLNNQQPADLRRESSGCGVLELKGLVGMGGKVCDSVGHEAPPVPSGTGRRATPAPARHDRWAARVGPAGSVDRLVLVRAGMGGLLPRW